MTHAFHDHIMTISEFSDSGKKPRPYRHMAESEYYVLRILIFFKVAASFLSIA